MRQMYYAKGSCGRANCTPYHGGQRRAGGGGEDFGSTPPDEFGNMAPAPTRKRIAVACGRCRKRKIRCSGDRGNGQPCHNCRLAGYSPCLFLRMASHEAHIRPQAEFQYNMEAARTYHAGGITPSSPQSAQAGLSQSPYDVEHIGPSAPEQPPSSSHLAPSGEYRAPTDYTYPSRPMAPAPQGYLPLPTTGWQNYHGNNNGVPYDSYQGIHPPRETPTGSSYRDYTPFEGTASHRPGNTAAELASTAAAATAAVSAAAVNGPTSDLVYMEYPYPGSSNSDSATGSGSIHGQQNSAMDTSGDYGRDLRSPSRTMSASSSEPYHGTSNNVATPVSPVYSVASSHSSEGGIVYTPPSSNGSHNGSPETAFNNTVLGVTSPLLHHHSQNRSEPYYSRPPSPAVAAGPLYHHHHHHHYQHQGPHAHQMGLPALSHQMPSQNQPYGQMDTGLRMPNPYVEARYRYQDPNTSGQEGDYKDPRTVNNTPASSPVISHAARYHGPLQNRVRMSDPSYHPSSLGAGQPGAQTSAPSDAFEPTIKYDPSVKYDPNVKYEPNVKGEPDAGN